MKYYKRGHARFNRRLIPRIGLLLDAWHVYFTILLEWRPRYPTIYNKTCIENRALVWQLNSLVFHVPGTKYNDRNTTIRMSLSTIRLLLNTTRYENLLSRLVIPFVPFPSYLFFSNYHFKKIKKFSFVVHDNRIPGIWQRIQSIHALNTRVSIVDFKYRWQSVINQ